MESIGGGSPESRRRPIQLSGVNWGTLRERIALLRRASGARCAFLMDISGRVLIESGSVKGLDPSVLGVLMANSMASALELAQLMGEDRLATMHLHEGRNFDVYGSIIDEETFICLVMDRHGARPRVGMVWLYLKRGVEEFRRLLGDVRTDLGVLAELDEGEVETAITEVWQEQPARDHATERSQGEEIPKGKDGKGSGPLLGYDEAVRLGLIGKDVGGGS